MVEPLNVNPDFTLIGKEIKINAKVPCFPPLKNKMTLTHR
jgi:hypothetical protein